MSDFGKIGFAGKLRPSQHAASQIIRKQLSAGEKKLLIVAPPGSGKTVLGLYVWSDLVRKPAVVLSPNSAIQAQWIARAEELFELDGRETEIGTDSKKPGILTSLTYQAVTMPRKGGEDLNQSAIHKWITKLMEGDADGISQAESPAAAMIWIEDLKDKNPDYYSERLGFYRKKARDEIAEHGNALWILHESSKENLKRLAEVGVGLIILDECHHLLEHWGRVLAEVRNLFDDPVILGLTATPPDIGEVDRVAATRYIDFFGEVDYQVPVPALVRDGNLAPYQDLTYFVRPTQDELRYVSKIDEEFTELIASICKGPGEDEKNRTPSLENWLEEVLDGRILPSGPAKDWKSFCKRDPTLAELGSLYLYHKHQRYPAELSALPSQSWNDQDIIPLLDRYIRNGLMRSKSKKDHALAEEAKDRLRLLGVQITERGARACASPVGRVLAYSSSKYDALRNILEAEMQALGSGIRAVVVTDFEKTSATALVEGVLDKGAGGAVAAYRALLAAPSTDMLDPILMTGSTVLVDDDLLDRILPRFEQWVLDHNLEIEFNCMEREGFVEIRGRGEHWVPRYYTMMITELFQEGVTKCLVGTRGLLGEGWDASRINVLIDLTTVTTNMSINQLRGRSFRLDKHWPEKVANNWDIVCMAEEFRKGFDDYNRFTTKHSQLYGVCDDSAIEKGVGHVHAAFTEARPEGISQSLPAFNEEMLRRARNRPRTRDLWKIGEEFNSQATQAIELKPDSEFGPYGFPALKHLKSTKWTNASLVMAIAETVVVSLMELEELDFRGGHLAGGDRGGNWMRAYLEEASEEDSKIFAEAMREILGPLNNPRYIIPREVTLFSDTWLSNLLPEVLGRYFKRSNNEIVMYHQVPKVLARNKEDAAMFQKHWNSRISPGEVVYGHSEEGKEYVAQVKQDGLVPKVTFHKKNVYV